MLFRASRVSSGSSASASRFRIERYEPQLVHTPNKNGLLRSENLDYYRQVLIRSQCRQCCNDDVGYSSMRLSGRWWLVVDSPQTAGRANSSSSSSFEVSCLRESLRCCSCCLSTPTCSLHFHLSFSDLVTYACIASQTGHGTTSPAKGVRSLASW